MKKREDKKKEAALLHRTLEQASTVFVTGFEKLTVEADYELRKAVRSAGGAYKVVKNSLAEHAAQGTPSEQVLKGLTGMTSLALTSGDPVALAKVLTSYAKDHPSFTFKAGLVEGRVVDAGAIVALAQMPSREELLGKILYLIQAPAQSLARAIQGVGRNLAVVLDQAVKENKFRA
jgi:large subunit ribosomal protein L10